MRGHVQECQLKEKAKATDAFNHYFLILLHTQLLSDTYALTQVTVDTELQLLRKSLC